MALLRDDHLGFELRYRDFEHDWISYDVLCTWRGEAIFNDAPLKRHNAYWGSRAPGGFLVNEHRLCPFLPFFGDLLERREPGHLNLTEPDMTIAAWPKAAFPFQPSKSTLVREWPQVTAERAVSEAQRAEVGGFLETDQFQLIVAFDAYQFTNSLYTGAGPALHMMPSWGDLRDFQEALRQEFKAFEAIHGLLARAIEEVEPSDDQIAWWRAMLA